MQSNRQTAAPLVQGLRCGSCKLGTPSVDVPGFLDCPGRPRHEHVSPFMGIPCRLYVPKAVTQPSSATQETADFFG